MEKLKRLMSELISGNLKAKDFADQYIKHMNTIRNNQNAFLAFNPEISLSLKVLQEQIIQGKLSRDEFFSETNKLLKDVQLSVLPYTEQSEILAHIYVDADAYRDPDEEPEAWNSDEKTLIEEVEKALKRLGELESISE